MGAVIATLATKKQRESSEEGDEQENETNDSNTRKNPSKSQVNSIYGVSRIDSALISTCIIHINSYGVHNSHTLDFLDYMYIVHCMSVSLHFLEG